MTETVADLSGSPPVREPKIAFVDVKGRRLRVAVWPGDRAHTPLLLFNGIGASIELLASFAQAIGDDIEVIAFDVPGVGESPPPALPYRLWMLARLTSALLDRLGYGRVDVMGVSWGGTLAQQFALQNPRRCRKLVLAATAQGMPMMPGTPAVLMRFLDARRHNDVDFLRDNFGAMYGGTARVRPDLAEAVGRLMKGVSARGYFLQQFAIAGWSSVAWLPFLAQRTLLLAGNDDPIVPLINAQLMTLLIRRSRLYVFDDGHLFLLFKTAESVRIVREFLDAEE